MNHTQQRKRRPLVTMTGHALCLSIHQHQNDRASAHHMRQLVRLVTVKPETRHQVLAGLLAVREG